MAFPLDFFKKDCIISNMKTIDLIVGSDHRGRDLAQSIEKHIVPIDKDIKKDITSYFNAGVYDEKKKVDYPDIVKKLVSVMKDDYNRGILICGSGYGVSIAANRYKGIRAVVCRTPKEAEMARRHNDANVLCLGADFTNKEESYKIVDAFLTTKFEGGRHLRRVKKLGELCD